MSAPPPQPLLCPPPPPRLGPPARCNERRPLRCIPAAPEPPPPARHPSPALSARHPRGPRLPAGPACGSGRRTHPLAGSRPGTLAESRELDAPPPPPPGLRPPLSPSAPPPLPRGGPARCSRRRGALRPPASFSSGRRVCAGEAEARARREPRAAPAPRAPALPALPVRLLGVPRPLSCPAAGLRLALTRAPPSLVTLGSPKGCRGRPARGRDRRGGMLCGAGAGLPQPLASRPRPGSCEYFLGLRELSGTGGALPRVVCSFADLGWMDAGKEMPWPPQAR